MLFAATQLKWKWIFSMEHADRVILSVMLIAETLLCPTVCPDTSPFVPTQSIDVDFEVQCAFLLHCATCFDMLNCSEERVAQKPAAAAIFAIFCLPLYATQLTVRPLWVSENENEEYETNFFTHEQCRSRACGLLRQYLNFPPLSLKWFHLISHLFFFP